MDVARAVGRADDRLRREAVGDAQPGREIVRVGVDEGAVVDGSVGRLQERGGRGIEVRQVVAVLPLRRPELVAQPEIERQVRRDAPVVLQVAEMHPLAELEDKRIDELVGIARADQEVDQVERRRVGRRAGRPAELPAVPVRAVLRVHVVDIRIDVLILVAGLERVAAADPRVVQARVDDERVLELGVAALPAPCRPAADRLLRQAAGKHRVGRQPRDAVGLEHVRAAGAECGLARLGARDADADLEQRRQSERPRHATRDLLVQDVDVGIRRAARLARNRRRFEVIGVASAEADERARRAC